MFHADEVGLVVEDGFDFFGCEGAVEELCGEDFAFEHAVGCGLCAVSEAEDELGLVFGVGVRGSFAVRFAVGFAVAEALDGAVFFVGEDDVCGLCVCLGFGWAAEGLGAGEVVAAGEPLLWGLFGVDDGIEGDAVEGLQGECAACALVEVVELKPDDECFFGNGLVDG